MTPKVASLISLIEECCKSGEIENANFSCKYMMPYSFNIPSLEKMTYLKVYLDKSGTEFNWIITENLSSPTA